MVDVARRLSEDNHIHVAEIWSYHVVGDEPRFTLVHRNKEAQPPVPRPRPPVAAGPPARPAAPSRKPVVARAKAARTLKSAKTSRPVRSKTSKLGKVTAKRNAKRKSR
jgi:hypothetical protein